MAGRWVSRRETPIALLLSPARPEGKTPPPRLETFDESGRREVFVRTFPASPAKWQISTGGGNAPVWRRDGKELFYLAPDGRLVAVLIARSAGGLAPGEARALFQMTGLRALTRSGELPYTVAADGLRFLAAVSIGEAESSPIMIRTGDWR